MWKSVTRYHPRIGYTFMPSVKSRIPWETGGYLVRTNAAGFRSDQEFVRKRAAGSYRAILFGDSQTAGDGVANARRYSDVVASLVPNLEVYNYGLPATSTDQHYLVYQDCVDVEYDLLLIGMHVENIGQVAHRFRPYKDAEGNEVIYAKPYYTLTGNELVLNHVPVPKTPLTRATMSADDARYIEQGVPYPSIRNVVKKLGMRDVMQRITRFQPLPDYGSAESAKWRLLRTILEAWIARSTTPVLLFLLPMWPYIEESSDPSGYQARFRELAEATGCYVHDPLPDLQRYTAGERRAFRYKVDAHFTPAAHQALAESLAGAIERVMADQRR